MFYLHHKDHDGPIQKKIDALSPPDTSIGGIVIFEGRVRNLNEGKEVRSLAYTSYEELALKEGNRIIEEAMSRFDVVTVNCIHQLGSLTLGELAVWVQAAAAHRGPAFEACMFVIDEVKARVPIWKQEHYSDGKVEWVACHHEAHSPGQHQHGVHHHG